MNFSVDSLQNSIIEDDDNDYEDASNTENKVNVQQVIFTKQVNTKPHQIQKMIDAAEEISGKKLNKKEINSFWENLAGELNNMGPPLHSTAEWRRVWTMFKSNKKRKHSGLYQEQDFPPLGNSGDCAWLQQVIYKLDLLLEKRNENVNQSGDELQQGELAGAQRSNSSMRTYGPTEQIADNLPGISIKPNEVFKHSGPVHGILEKLDILLDKRNESVNQYGDILQQGKFAGAQRSNSGMRSYGPTEQLVGNLPGISIKPNEVVKHSGPVHGISDTWDVMLDTRDENVNQSGDILQQGKLAGAQRSNSSTRTYGPTEQIADNLTRISGKPNDVVKRSVPVDGLDTLDVLLDKRNANVNQSVQQEVNVGPFDQILEKLNPILDKISQTLDNVNRYFDKQFV